MSPDTERIGSEFASQQILARFLVRSALIVFLAVFITESFWLSLALLSLVAGLSCCAVAVLRKESPTVHLLTSWDEAAGHFAVFALVRAFGQV